MNGLYSPGKMKVMSDRVFNMTIAAVGEAIKVRDESDNVDKCLRIAVKGGGCAGFSYSMKFDVTGDNDSVFDFDELTVIIDNRSLMYLDGVEMDFTSGLDGNGFTFNNPNATRTCGCNKSFGV